MDIQALHVEVSTDPVALGLSWAKTDAEILSIINDETLRTKNKTTMTPSEVFNAIVTAEWDGLIATNQSKIFNVLGFGEVNPFGFEAKIFKDVLGAGSVTITNLANLRKEPISRAAEIGFGRVRHAHVIEARSL